MITHADDVLVERIRNLTAPLQPTSTGVVPDLAPLDGIRAVLFDVYGTLVISGCGDIGLTQSDGTEDPFIAAWAAAELDPNAMPPDGPDTLIALIRADHAASRSAGVDCPEVNILGVWHRLLETQGLRANEEVLRRLALEYELRTNPVWPMPDLAAVLAELAGRGLVLGIVSNAQFYTPLMLETFLGQPLETAGFDLDCCAWSYRHGVAKPSTSVYAPALQRLRERRDIAPAQVLYIGNDMRNDVRPARALGCRTALFAGDARSLRLREGDPGMEQVRPDRIVTALTQLVETVLPAR
jgi:putative hydrolase of the HAD superfamily